MVNWILGGIIIGLTVYTVVKSLMRLREGRSGCSCDSSCGNCSGNRACK